MLMILTINVSIPFKREGVSERTITGAAVTEEQVQFQFPSNGKVFPNLEGWEWVPSEQKWFQFPSNGKVFPNSRGNLGCSGNNFVSIPFKREGVSERCRVSIALLTLAEFQFPSNGKVFPNFIRRFSSGY